MAKTWRERTKAQKLAAVKRLAKSDCGKVDASKKLGIHLTTLYNFLHKHDIEWTFKANPGRKEQNFPTSQIAAFYEDGNTMKQTAEHFGICVHSVRNRLERAGVTPRPSAAQINATLAQHT
jgi:transposase